jgi:hypothetical protein
VGGANPSMYANPRPPRPRVRGPGAAPAAVLEGLAATYDGVAARSKGQASAEDIAVVVAAALRARCEAALIRYDTDPARLEGALAALLRAPEDVAIVVQWCCDQPQPAVPAADFEAIGRAIARFRYPGGPPEDVRPEVERRLAERCANPALLRQETVDDTARAAAIEDIFLAAGLHDRSFLLEVIRAADPALREDERHMALGQRYIALATEPRAAAALADAQRAWLGLQLIRALRRAEAADVLAGLPDLPRRVKILRDLNVDLIKEVAAHLATAGEQVRARGERWTDLGR